MPKSAETDPQPTASRLNASSSNAATIAVLAVAIVVVLTVLYALSIGPMVWLESRGYIAVAEDSWLFTFYFPVHWVAYSSDFTRAVFEAYVDFWSA